MLNTTFALATKARACESSYKKMGEALCGITTYGKKTPIPLDKVLKTLGLQDTVWAFRCTIEPPEDILIEFVCRCAEHVLHFYADKYPDDKRPQKAIYAARACITDKSHAARAAAGDAASDAWDAGADAEAAREVGAAGAAGVAREVGAAGAAGAASAEAAWAASRPAARAADWVSRAAGRAADGAAWAAWDDAGPAARAAEIEWQTKTLLELLTKAEGS